LNSNETNPAIIAEAQMAISEITFENSMKSRTIGQWSAEFGNKTIPIVADIIHYFIRLFNVKETLNDAQMIMCATKLLKEYPNVRIKELVQCLSKATTGDYGSTYQRIGINNVFEWLNEYYKQQDDFIVSEHLKNKPTAINTPT